MKKCKICKKEINVKKEAWVELVDYIGEVKTDTGYYHKQCLRDLIKGKGEIIENKLMERIAGLSGKIIGKVMRQQRELEI